MLCLSLARLAFFIAKSREHETECLKSVSSGYDNLIFWHLRHFYAADLLIKIHCLAGFMLKLPEVPEYFQLASGYSLQSHTEEQHQPLYPPGTRWCRNVVNANVSCLAIMYRHGTVLSDPRRLGG